MAEDKYNLKNPAVKRILQEVKEMQSNPSDDFMSLPLEENIFEWQFAIRGPCDSEFEGGIYHGRIQLPAEYPFKPPSFMVLTPNGRFETQTKVCLSISNHHPEHWQPSWSVRTALVALIAFMPTNPNGALGSLDYKKEERRALAIKSREAAPKFGTPERQKLIDEIHEYMLSKAPPIIPQLSASESSKEQPANREVEAQANSVDTGSVATGEGLLAPAGDRIIEEVQEEVPANVNPSPVADGTSREVPANEYPDIVTYGIMVDILCKAGRVDEALAIVRGMDTRVCRPTSFIYSVLVHTYGVENQIEDAVDTFLEMEKNGIQADVAMYNALIGAFCKANKFKNVYRVLKEMDSKGVAPNSRTCNIILNGLIGCGETDEAYRVFRRMIKVCEADADTYTMMIKMFCQGRELEKAFKVWKYMKLMQFIPSMHTFSVLINGLCDKGNVSEACVLLEDMIEKGIRPSGPTFAKLRKLLIKEGREDVLKFLQEKMNLLIKEPLCD